MGGRRFRQMGAGDLDERRPEIRAAGGSNERAAGDSDKWSRRGLDEWLAVIRSNLRVVDG